MITLAIKKHWLAIVLALVTALLLFGFVHRCAGHASTPSLAPSSISPDSPATPATPATITSWLANLDWQAIGMAIGAVLTGIGTFYQLVVKWRAGAVTIDAVIDGGKGLFGNVAKAEAAFKRPMVTSVPPAPQPPSQDAPK